jgi:hypothetical protein
MDKLLEVGVFGSGERVSARAAVEVHRRAANP